MVYEYSAKLNNAFEYAQKILTLKERKKENAILI